MHGYLKVAPSPHRIDRCARVDVINCGWSCTSWLCNSCVCVTSVCATSCLCHYFCVCVSRYDQIHLPINFKPCSKNEKKTACLNFWTDEYCTRSTNQSWIDREITVNHRNHRFSFSFFFFFFLHRFFSPITLQLAVLLVYVLLSVGLTLIFLFVFSSFQPTDQDVIVSEEMKID